MMRILVIKILLLSSLGFHLQAQQKFYGKKKHQQMVYEFVNDVMVNVGKHGSVKVYLEEAVRGNKCYAAKPDRIFLDRIRLMDIKLLDAHLTQKDIDFMKLQANELLFKKWNSKSLTLENLEVIPSASARKEGKHQSGLYMGISLPFFSQDGKKAIFFMCREDLKDGWDAIALYQQTAEGWKLITTKLTLWHTKE